MANHMHETPHGAVAVVDPKYLADRDLRFRTDLEHLLNRHSRENGSDTPDFILAEYLAGCLAAWDQAVSLRTAWYKPADPNT